MSDRLSVLSKRLTLTIAGCLLGAAACRSPEADAPLPAADVPVFVISIDTLRSDRLPAYGYSRIKTPAIDAMRRDALLFANAFSHVPLTLPAHASIFTGAVPPKHRVRDNIGYVLDPAAQTLAETLAANGYRSGAAVSSYVLRRSSGIAQGFDFYDDELDYEATDNETSAERGGDRTREVLERWIEGESGSRLFGFLHLYEPHAPYRGGYDAEVERADAIVGRFLDFLKRRGLYDRSLIVILSDHGEGLGDHGEDEHGIFVYRESLQVPLLVKLPGNVRGGEKVDTLASLVDVSPTILKRIGLNMTGTNGIDGTDLLETKPGVSKTHYAETYYPRLHYGWHELRSMIDLDHHFIEAPVSELYRHRTDPAESKNLADSERRTAFELRQRLDRYPPQFQPPSAVDPEDQRKLAALGYLGSTAPAGASLPDPKLKIGTVRDLRAGMELLLSGRNAKAAEHFARFVAANPDVIDAWWMWGQSLRGAGRREEALTRFQSALRRFPSHTNLALSTADLLFEMGRYDEARRHAELALTRDGVLARELLARMELKRGNRDAAQRELMLAHQLEPARTGTMMLLADAAKRRRDHAQELSWLDRAQSEVAKRRLRPIRGLEFRRGEALLSLQQIVEAETAFRAETTRFPDHEQAWASLAVVVAARGRRPEATALIDEALRRNPTATMKRLAAEAMDVVASNG